MNCQPITDTTTATSPPTDCISKIGINYSLDGAKEEKSQKQLINNDALISRL